MTQKRRNTVHFCYQIEDEAMAVVVIVMDVVVVVNGVVIVVNGVVIVVNGVVNYGTYMFCHVLPFI